MGQSPSKNSLSVKSAKGKGKKDNTSTMDAGSVSRGSGGLQRDPSAARLKGGKKAKEKS